MIKKFIDINLLPEKVKENYFTADEAVKIIAADVLEKPFNYNIRISDEETRSELSLRLLQQADYIFRHFKPSLCTFKTFLCSFIHFQIMNIMRDKYRNEAVEEHITNMSVLSYEDEEDKYEKDEASFLIGHCQNSKKVPEKRTESEGAVNYLNENGFSAFFETKPEKKIKTTLVLALKSSYFLTPDHIDRISRYCGIKRKELETLVNEIKESLEKKSRLMEQTREKRDKSFQLHMKFQKLIEKAENTEKRQEFKVKYIRHTENWNRKNILLKKQAARVCPTNKRLAELLGICERQVGYYLQQAEDLLEKENID